MEEPYKPPNEPPIIEEFEPYIFIDAEKNTTISIGEPNDKEEDYFYVSNWTMTLNDFKIVNKE